MSVSDVFRIAVRKFDPFETAILAQWKKFAQESDIQLQLEAVPMDLHELYDSLFTHKGLIEGDWDIAFVSTDWMAAAAEQGNLTDLAARLDADPPEGYPEGWMPSLLRMQCIDKHVLGVPYHNGPECLLYRKDLFDDPIEQHAYQTRYGTSLKVPETWREFRQVATFFQRPEKHLFGTVFAAFPDGHNTVYDFLLQVWTRGGELFDADGKVLFSTPECAAALEFYRSMLRTSDAVHPDCREMDSVKSGLAFANGEVALMVNWFGFAAMAETAEWSQVKGRVDVAPIPFDDHGQTTSLNSYWLLSIARGSRHQETAYQFLKCCMTPAMDKLLSLSGGVGCRRSTWNDPDVTGQISAYSRLEKLHERTRELPRRSDWPEIASKIDNVMLRTMNTELPIRQILLEADTQ